MPDTMQPQLGYGQPTEVSIDKVNQWMRSQPWYQGLLKSWGQDPNNVHLNDQQKAQIIRQAQANGVVVDQGNMEVDPSGNFNPVGHKLRNTLIVAGLAAATIGTMGAAGAFSGAAAGAMGAGAGGGAGAAAGTAGTLAGIEGGAAGLVALGRSARSGRARWAPRRCRRSARLGGRRLVAAASGWRGRQQHPRHARQSRGEQGRRDADQCRGGHGQRAAAGQLRGSSREHLQQPRHSRLGDVQSRSAVSAGASSRAGDLMSTMKDAAPTGDPRIDKFGGGGLRPSAFGPATQQAGDELKRQALKNLLSGQGQINPQLTTPKRAGFGENALAGAGIGLNILEAYGRFGR
jgi:hypothetical protein